MRWILFIIILAPCYALEVIICEKISGTYDCQIYSEPEKPYLEDVIHVTESEGFNSDLANERNNDSEDEKPLDSVPYQSPLIFPLVRYW